MPQFCWTYPRQSLSSAGKPISERSKPSLADGFGWRDLTFPKISLKPHHSCSRPAKSSFLLFLQKWDGGWLIPEASTNLPNLYHKYFQNRFTPYQYGYLLLRMPCLTCRMREDGQGIISVSSSLLSQIVKVWVTLSIATVVHLGHLL